MTLTHVLITGATGGVGQALALEYAAQDVLLTLTGRSRERLNAIAALCRDKGAEVSTHSLDIRDAYAVREWVLGVDRERPVDLALANAGVSSAIQPDGSGEPFEDVERLFSVNTLGVAATVCPLAERMRARGHGQLAIIGSISGLRGFPDTPAYSASKAAVRTYGKALRGWLADSGVRVSVVTMGFVDSPMSARYDGGKPLRCSAEKAARRIRRGLERNKGEILFPRILAVGVWSLNLLIEPVANRVLRTFFKCSVKPDGDSPLGRK
ncbi:MAG: SDR family NAD(P)-dependent oxidoreductase [Desulfovibrionaceae bacterium]|nr:SDR family NAD(P)-dependent oxidoreductase [Desulfovibrionaceae bacterium]